MQKSNWDKNLDHFLTQVILGIIFPPLILLLDFRLGDDASYHAPGDKEEGKEKEDDNKSSKVGNDFDYQDLCSLSRLRNYKLS